MHKKVKGMRCKRCDDCSDTKVVTYSDGTPSREIEDWETSGQEEMNQLAQKHEKVVRPIGVADRLENLECLIRTCASALSGNNANLSDISFILHIQVINELKTAQKEIWSL